MVEGRLRQLSPVCCLLSCSCEEQCFSDHFLTWSSVRQTFDLPNCVAQVTLPEWLVNRLPSMLIFTSVHIDFKYFDKVFIPTACAPYLTSPSSLLGRGFLKNLPHYLGCISCILWTPLQRIDSWMAQHIGLTVFGSTFRCWRPPSTFSEILP